MVTPCPYCGKEQRAVKNHIRLTDGDGHGPAGQYPEGWGERRDRGEPDPGGGGVEVMLEEDVDEDAPEPGHVDTGDGAIAAEALEEPADELPEWDEEGEEESIIAMPESELKAMLGNAAETAEEAVPSAETVIERIEDEGGVVRFGEIVETDTLALRQTLDDLVIEGELKRFAVGDHIMLKRL